jgi:hypothetical protein
MSDKEKAPSEHLLGANLSSRGPKKKNQVHFTFLCLSRKNLHGSLITHYFNKNYTVDHLR